MEFRAIEPGGFQMGEGHKKHQVPLTQGFWADTYPVTRSEFMEVTGFNPSCFTKSGDRVLRRSPAVRESGDESSGAGPNSTG